MKARFTFLAVPLMVGVALAQSSGSGSQSGQTGSDTKTAETKSSETKTTTSQAGSAPAQMKTMTYKGTLVDLGCGATPNTASAAPAATPSDTNAAPAAPAATTSETNAANRSAGDTSSCAVSANTSQFGLKTDGGQVYRFDMVGNQRAQDQFKSNKHWSNAATANKPLKVRISGVVQGDKLIVSSIN